MIFQGSSRPVAAVIGCGRMGLIRAAAAQQLGVDVEFFVDPSAERREFILQRFPRAVAFDNVDALDWRRVDAVFICIPPGLRTAAAEAAITTRTNALIEKPIAVSADQATRLLELQQLYGGLVAVGYMNRCRPTIKEVRRTLRDSILGVVGLWAGTDYQKDWWLDESASGGPFNEQGTHLVDLARFMLQDVSLVSAMRDGASENAEATVAAVMRSGFGRLASLFYTRAAAQKSISFSVLTSVGTIRWSGWDFKLVENTTGIPLQDSDEDIFLEETRAFFQAAIDGTGDVGCDLMDAFESQMAMEAIKASLRSGVPTAPRCAIRS